MVESRQRRLMKAGDGVLLQGYEAGIAGRHPGARGEQVEDMSRMIVTDLLSIVLRPVLRSDYEGVPWFHLGKLLCDEQAGGLVATETSPDSNNYYTGLGVLKPEPMQLLL